MRCILIIIFIQFTALLFGQSACDSLEILQVNVDAFHTNQINIKINNSSSDIFSYPGFRILDEDQNLIGEEEVWFFGISGESNHIVEFNPAEYIFETLTTYDITIELWVNFYEEMVCSFSLSTTLLPQPIDCVDVGIIFSEFSSEAASYEFSLNDISGNEIHSEVLLFQPGVGLIERYFCLFPGCYELAATTDIAPEFSQLNVNLEALYGYGFLFSELLSQQQENSIEFGLWTDCSTISVKEFQHEIPIKIYPNPAQENIYVEAEFESQVLIYNNQGQIIRNFICHPFEPYSLNIQYLNSGIYHIRVAQSNQYYSTSFIKK